MSYYCLFVQSSSFLDRQGYFSTTYLAVQTINDTVAEYASASSVTGCSSSKMRNMASSSMKSFDYIDDMYDSVACSEVNPLFTKVRPPWPHPHPS